MKEESFERLSTIACKFGIDLIFLFGSMKETGLSMLRGEEVILLGPPADLDVGKERLVQIAGYRNRMAHFYYEITPAELYNIVNEDIFLVFNFSE